MNELFCSFSSNMKLHPRTISNTKNLFSSLYTNEPKSPSFSKKMFFTRRLFRRWCEKSRPRFFTAARYFFNGHTSTFVACQLQRSMRRVSSFPGGRRKGRGEQIKKKREEKTLESNKEGLQGRRAMEPPCRFPCARA